jgi:hypothetical protein
VTPDEQIERENEEHGEWLQEIENEELVTDADNKDFPSKEFIDWLFDEKIPF